MTEKRKIDDTELEKVSGGGSDPNQHVSEVDSGLADPNSSDATYEISNDRSTYRHEQSQ